MKIYVCKPCGYIYEPQIGDFAGGESPDAMVNDLPEDWVCPMCSADIEDFEILE